MSTEMLISPSQYRYDTVKQHQRELQTLVDAYTIKKKKYQRRITALDITVYSVSGVIASTGIILSSVTMTAPIALPIIISAVTALTGIFTGVTKKISSCSTNKLRDYTLKLSSVISAYSELTNLISKSITDGEITEDEFSNISQVYNTTKTKLNNNNDIIYHNEHDNRISRTNSTKNQNNSTV